MVEEWFCDLKETGGDVWVDGYRCLLCGNLVDVGILENRRRSTDPVGLTTLMGSRLPRLVMA
jgi:hypothetical protein